MKKIVKRRKLRIKRIILALIIVILLLVVSVYFGNKLFFYDDSDIKVNTTDWDVVIEDIVSYSDNRVDSKFLEWILENYGEDVILDLENKFGNGYSDEIWREVVGESLFVLLDKYNGLFNESDSNIKMIEEGNGMISFVGDVSLADDWYIMPKYDERKKGVYGILSDEVVDIMTNSSVMVANNEFTISDRGSKMPKKYYTFRGSPARLSIYEEMGVDLVTLANNHVFDYGEEAFYDTLNSLDEYNLPYVGAGRNLDEAMEPYYFIVNGYKIGFVNATRAEKFVLTPGASDNAPGVFRCYDPTNFIRVIEETKKNSDYVVALVHWGKEDSTELEDVQIETARDYIDAGADMIVGSHAHNLQGIDFYNGKAIIYNLGDFIFNNETKDTAIFQFRINNDGSLDYYFVPCKESGEYTYLLHDDEKNRVLEFMKDLSPNVTFDDNGKFYSR